MSINTEALLNVARACRECRKPEEFTMRIIGHNRGTPGCALGQYAARDDLQTVFILDDHGDLRIVNRVPGIGITSTVQAHFGIDEFEDDELFGSRGCGGAKTPPQAAEYIERFVASRA